MIALQADGNGWSLGPLPPPLPPPPAAHGPAAGAWFPACILQRIVTNFVHQLHCPSGPEPLSARQPICAQPLQRAAAAHMTQEQPEERQEAAETAQQLPGREDEPSAEQRLMEAAAAGDGPLVAQLLRDGAEPACETEEGITPLMLAAQSGSEEAVQTLLGALRLGGACAPCIVRPLWCSVPLAS